MRLFSKRIAIDFAAPSLQRTVYRAGPLAWTLAAAGLLACALAALLGWRLLAQQKDDSARLSAARLRANAPKAVTVVVERPRISEQQAGVVNAAVLQLNLPWRALHDTIAAATPPAIALLALEPDSKKRSIKITAEARSSDEMVGYVEQLKQQELFAGVILTRHEINEQDPNRPIRFQLEAEWVSP